MNQNIRRGAIAAGAGLLALCGGPLKSSTMTMTSYYPSPSGVYGKLRSLDQTVLAQNGGNVGIGTSAPGFKLTVAGDFAPSGAIRSLKGTTGLVTGVASEDAQYLFYRNSETNWAGFGVDGSGDVWLRTGLASPNKFMVLMNDGSLGVGTSAPSERLEVNGNARAAAFYGRHLSASGGRPFRVLVWYNDCTGATTACPTGYTQRGRWHVGESTQCGQPPPLWRGVGDDGATIISGWMQFCAAD